VAVRRPPGAIAAGDPALRLVIGASLFVLAGLAWAWTGARAGMPACHCGGLVPFLVMWAVMMAAMMFPSVVPVVLAFVALARGRSRNTLWGAVLFVAGYVVVWTLLGLPARALLEAADGAVAAFPPLARAGGALLVLCGLYQLTPLKNACLRHCRVPQLFLGHHWRDGLGGAFVLGAHHGLYCAGCCASLMVVLLVVGMMDVRWMIALTAVIYLEKVLPVGATIGRLAGIALCVLGVARFAG
jgi:predicted metal-binding membrane protein